MCTGNCGSSKLNRALKAIGHGMLGVAKAILKVDVAPKTVIDARVAICKQCPHAVPCMSNKANVCWCGPLWDSVWGDRPTCGCNIKYKTMLRDESCPLGKWSANKEQGAK